MSRNTLRGRRLVSQSARGTRRASGPVVPKSELHKLAHIPRAPIIPRELREESLAQDGSEMDVDTLTPALALRYVLCITFGGVLAMVLRLVIRLA